MATRKIIDIEQNGEKVWPKGHANATFMSDGKTVEDAINQIGTGGDCQSPYVLPFDIETLDGLSYSDNEGRLQTDADVFEKTKSAIEMGRMIVIRYSSSDAGYHICDATYNGDAISVRVYNGLMLYSFEIYASSQGNILVEQYSLQSELVDGVNIATINGQSLTAGGDITIKGGSDVEVPTKVSQLENDAEYITQEDVAAVALSGSYNDLSNKPTIPAAVTESTVSSWGFTKNTGTVTGVKINGTTKNPSSGVVDLGTVITDVSNLATKDEAIFKDVTGELITAHTQALYGGGSVYALPDQANGNEDDVLLSRSSVKTINGQSIVGSGDIEIGGGSSSDTKREVIYLNGWNISITNMRPNVIYYLVGGPISIESFEDPVYGVKTYDVFTAVLELSYSSFTLPDYIVWANGVVPEFTVGEYELSISRISDGDYSNYYAVLTPFKSV